MTKVGHITCNNTSNNRTMMKEFAARLKDTTGKKYDWKKRKIKCIGPLIQELNNLSYQQPTAISHM